MTENSPKKFAARGGSFFARGFETYAGELNLTADDIKNLRGKKILLIGGGASPIKKNLTDLGIDCEVINIDPMQFKRNPENADVLITGDFINRHAIDEFDEVWAMYSLPLYAKNEYERDMFWTRAILGLKPGGHLRVAGRLETRHAKFFRKFNVRFPNSKLSFMQTPFVWKFDAAKITGKTDVDEFVGQLAAIRGSEIAMGGVQNP